jgi:hypothetical protein
VAHPQIAAFARMAKDNEPPRRLIYGQATLLSRTMHDIHYNELRDEFYVTNPFAQAILTFRGGADGNEAPIRIIQGPKTGLGAADTLEVDDIHEEIFVPHGDILVYPLDANGDVAPKRVVVGGPKTGWLSWSGVAVDPVHNILATTGSIFGTEREEGGGSYSRARDSILIFDRLADGEVKPLRVIRGPNTGIKAIRQMQIEPSGGWIVATQITSGSVAEPEGTFVGVWSIHDDGDIAPRWKIEGKPGIGFKKPRGVALNPKHKELLVSDMRQNAVFAYSFPELFE